MESLGVYVTVEFDPYVHAPSPESVMVMIQKQGLEDVIQLIRPRVAQGPQRAWV